ncbi:hypothetical protein MMC07_000979 [Pseudocyphellaria aurata]|nr:hypothetical protein [Pseudocyphellaria aurata]
MTVTKFSALPSEIHSKIAQHCENNDLINLCLTAKWVKERCLGVLYRTVDLERHQSGSDTMQGQEYLRMLDSVTRQQQFVCTMRNHPEYGKYVRYLKGPLTTVDFGFFRSLEENQASDEDLWSAMRSLTHVRRVDIGIKVGSAYLMVVPSTHIPSILFQSATSVSLEGQMQYALAKTILDSINPAQLLYLRLDMIQDRMTGVFQEGLRPGQRAEDGRIVAHGATTGLLGSLTGRCTGLRFLTMRRIGQAQNFPEWHAHAEQLSYLEWASFIRSVSGTLEKLLFEQAEEVLSTGPGPFSIMAPSSNGPLLFRIMDERFRRFVFPTLCSGHWPCLTDLELRGVRGWNSEGGEVEPSNTLRKVHGEKPWIQVHGLAYHVRNLI